MACTEYSLPMNPWTATDAGFRVWGKAWTDLLDLMGFDELYSNLDWATVTMPTTASTFAGKKVYSFNDTTSSTQEIYFSVEFGRGSTTVPSHGFIVRVKVGTAHDGNGNISNYSFSNYFSQTDAPSDGGSIVGVKSHLGFSIFTNISAGTTYQAGFAMERLAENLVATPDGVVCMVTGSGVNSVASLTSASFQTANYQAGQVFSALSPQSSANSDLLFRNIQSIPITVDSSYANKVPALTMDTFGKYDPCYHWVLASKYTYSSASEFEAMINGFEGLFRIPFTGFNADNGSTTYSALRLAMRVS